MRIGHRKRHGLVRFRHRGGVRVKPKYVVLGGVALVMHRLGRKVSRSALWQRVENRVSRMRQDRLVSRLEAIRSQNDQIISLLEEEDHGSPNATAG